MTTTPYDVAEHLRTPEESAAYLDIILKIMGALGLRFHAEVA